MATICSGGDLYILDTDVSVSFEDAIEECNDLYNATLASLPEEALENVTTFVLGQSPSTDVWIGAIREDFSDSEDGRDPEVYSWIDGEPDRAFFQVDVGEEPWNPNKPDNTNGNEACLHLEFQFVDQSRLNAGKFDDGKCDLKYHLLCKQKRATECSFPGESNSEGGLYVGISLVLLLLTMITGIMLLLETHKLRDNERKLVIVKGFFLGYESD